MSNQYANAAHVIRLYSLTVFLPSAMSSTAIATQTTSNAAQGILSLNPSQKDASKAEVDEGSGKEKAGEEEKLNAMSKQSRSAVPRPPTFETKEEEREYLKFRLAQAFRIFGRLGYDEGVAGHITVRVRQ